MTAQLTAPVTGQPLLSGERSRALQPIHRLPIWSSDPTAAPNGPARCGRSLVRYPDTQLVLDAGAPGPAHIFGSGHRDGPLEGLTVSQFDQQFLHRHAMAWSPDHRPVRKEQL
jgi:hypothetical protein